MTFDGTSRMRGFFGDHVETVKGAERDLPYRAALRRTGIDVIEMRKARRIFQIAEWR